MLIKKYGLNGTHASQQQQAMEQAIKQAMEQQSEQPSPEQVKAEAALALEDKRTEGKVTLSAAIKVLTMAAS